MSRRSDVAGGGCAREKEATSAQDTSTGEAFQESAIKGRVVLCDELFSRVSHKQGLLRRACRNGLDKAERLGV